MSSTVTLLNTSILTSFGDYQYKEITLEHAMEFVNAGFYQSAIGHASTAQIMTELLGVPVEMNRMLYSQQVGEAAIVFKLNGRAPEGVILSREEIEKIGYSWGLLTRTA
jgi:hypothetical protein